LFFKQNVVQASASDEKRLAKTNSEKAVLQKIFINFYFK